MIQQCKRERAYLGHVEEEAGHEGEGEESNGAGDKAGDGAAHAALRLHGRAAEAARDGVCAEKGAGHVGRADGDHLLRAVNGVAVAAGQRLGDGDALDKADERHGDALDGEIAHHRHGQQRDLQRYWQAVVKPCHAFLWTAGHAPQAWGYRRACDR